MMLWDTPSFGEWMFRTRHCRGCRFGRCKEHESTAVVGAEVRLTTKEFNRLTLGELRRISELGLKVRKEK